MSGPALLASLSERLQTLRVAVDEALDHWLPTDTDCPSTLAAAMRYAVFPGGKRLRPVLVLLGCEACGGRQDAAMPGACAVELVHSYSLVHDDLPAMDDDDCRRGRPTCHKTFGEAVAILAGDALLTLAFEILARHCPDPELAASSCAELAAAAGAGGMVGGQVDDLSLGTALNVKGHDLEKLRSVHSRKTGAIFRACLRLGGLAAAATPDAMAALDGYGRSIGLAFQITDDLLDVFGDESKTGKRVGKDSGRGKLTYPGLMGIDECRRLVAELCQDACSQLESLGPRAEPLRQLAGFVMERDR